MRSQSRQRWKAAEGFRWLECLHVEASRRSISIIFWRYLLAVLLSPLYHYSRSAILIFPLISLSLPLLKKHFKRQIRLLTGVKDWHFLSALAGCCRPIRPTALQILRKTWSRISVSWVTRTVIHHVGLLQVSSTLEATFIPVIMSFAGERKKKIKKIAASSKFITSIFLLSWGLYS